MKRISESVLVLLLLLAATSLITLPFVLVMGGTLRDWNDALLQTWTLGWNGQQLLADPLHLYESPIFYPYPHTLAFSDAQLLESMVGLPLLLATGRAPLVQNLEVLLAFVLNGYGLYLLVRAWRGNWWGGLVGGFVFAFGFYHLNHFMHLDLLWTQWMPLTLLWLDQSLRRGRRRDFALLGLFFLLSALSTFYYAFFTAALCLLYGVWFVAARRGRLPRRQWLALGLTALAVALVIVPFGLPYLQLAQELGLRRPPDEIRACSANLAAYLYSPSRNPFFRLANTYFHPPNLQSVLSPGWLALLLAGYALIRRSAGARALPLVLIGATGIVLSFGLEQQWGGLTVPLPYRLLYDYAPGFAGSMRDVARWGVLLLLAVAILAGIGFSDLTSRLAQMRAWAPVGLGALVLAGFLLEYNQAPLEFMPGQPFDRPVPPVYQWLAAQPDGVLAELPMGAPGDQYAPDTWYEYYGLFHHKRMVNGASGFAPPYHADTVERLSHFPSQDALDLLHALGVRYVIVHTQADANWAKSKDRLPLFDHSLRLAASFGDDLVFEVLPEPLPAPALALVLPAKLLGDSSARGFITARSSMEHSAPLSTRGIVGLVVRWRDAAGQVALEESRSLAAPLQVDESGAVLAFDLRAPSEPGDYRVSVEVNGLAAPTHVEQTVTIAERWPRPDGPALQLADAWVAPRATRAADDLRVTLTWQVRERPDDDFQVSLAVRDAGGQVRAALAAQADPSGSMQQWPPGSVQVVQYAVPLPKGLPQGKYSLAVALTDPGDKQPIEIGAPDGQPQTELVLGRPVWIGAGWNQSAPRPANAARADFENNVQLLGYDLKGSTFASGDTLPLALYWQAAARTTLDYAVVVELVDGHGQVVALTQSPPRGGDYPTQVWNDGEWIRDPQPLTLPAGLTPGAYTLRVGWTLAGSGARVGVRGGETPADSVSLAVIRIER